MLGGGVSSESGGKGRSHKATVTRRCGKQPLPVRCIFPRFTNLHLQSVGGCSGPVAGARGPEGGTVRRTGIVDDSVAVRLWV